jgi:hypothetical protein
MNILKHRLARISLLAIFPIAWGIAVLSMAAKPSPWVKKTLSDGSVKAVLSYERSAAAPHFRNIQLKIFQNGRRVFQAAVPRDRVDDQVLAEQSEQAFQIRDLDRDGQPEVIVDLFTGGTHCCTYSQIYHFDAAGGSYRAIQHRWGNSFYQLVDLDGDGTPEFLSRDDRFTSQFTSYAGSANPLQIWHYRQGKLIDQTRAYRPQLEASAQQHLIDLQRVAANQGDVKGIIAAYLADRYSLGQRKEGWKLVEQLYKAQDREQFFSQVQQFLRKTGYVDASSGTIAATEDVESFVDN